MAQLYKPDELPPCAHGCEGPTRRTTGAEIYPHRADLAQKVMFVCPACNAYVGSHEANGAALGRPANAKLRDARQKLHGRIDPIWQQAPQTGGYLKLTPESETRIRHAARHRVYAFLAETMGISRKRCHVAKFDIEQCRRAWSVLNRVSYPEIRAWWKANRPAKAETEASA